MNFPKPQFIANLLVEKGNNTEFQKLDQIIFSVCRAKFPSPSDEEIWDYIESYLEDISRELYIKKSDHIDDAIKINFEIENESGDYYLKFLNTPETKLLRKIQADTPENFEFFCAKILDKLGGKSIVSGGSNDGGIDFTSTEILINNLPNLSTKGSRILIIGQAKRYIDGNQVKEKELRDFVGASIRKIDQMKRSRSEQFGILQPTILAFWTTSDFNPSAKEYAKDIGIWYLGGIALCQLAIHLDVEV